ncbi:hypothetical protein ACFYR1_04940 [Streptomyces canus]|uniref:hypothetical protein n=1 Tax=Streptomyces canus TaxID=58343 RepID=UPI0036948C6A
MTHAETELPPAGILAVGEPLLEFNADADGAQQAESSRRATERHVQLLGDAPRSGGRTGYLTRSGDDTFGTMFMRL